MNHHLLIIILVILGSVALIGGGGVTVYSSRQLEEAEAMGDAYAEQKYDAALTRFALGFVVALIGGILLVAIAVSQ